MDTVSVNARVSAAEDVVVVYVAGASVIKLEVKKPGYLVMSPTGLTQ